MREKVPEEYSSKALKAVGLYLLVLVFLQVLVIFFVFFHEPSLHKGIPLMIFLGTVLPALLAFIFTRFVKVS